MLLWSNIFLSMASLVICMQLRCLFHEIQRRYKKHKNYLWAKNHLEQKYVLFLFFFKKSNNPFFSYPMASPEELAENSDNCAICWEKMDSARKLPCTHLFHKYVSKISQYNFVLCSFFYFSTCLQSWLEQDTSCPTCRLPLNIQNPVSTRFDSPEMQNDAPQPPRRQLNHFFHFDGSRYVSWLPSFSVEVSHAQLLGNHNHPPTPNSQLDAMARQVCCLH